MARTLQKIWNIRFKVIPLVIDSFGAMPNQFWKRLKDIVVFSRNRTVAGDSFTRYGQINMKAS